MQNLWAGIQSIGWGVARRIVVHAFRSRWLQARFTPAFLTTRRPLIRTLPALMTFPTSAAPQPLGQMLSAEILSQQISARCVSGHLSLGPVMPHILRLRLTRQSPPPPYFSYATVIEPQPVAVEISESADRLALSAQGWQAHIQRRPVAVQLRGEKNWPIEISQVAWDEAGGRLEIGLPEGVQLYGLGERACNLVLNGKRFELTTFDQAGYRRGDDPLYINIPFLLVVGQGFAFGILFDSTHNGVIDLSQDQGRRLSYAIDGDELRLDLITGPDAATVIERYTALTGRMALPPRWALGYHQSRWSYETAEIVREIAHQFRQRRIPCDAIHLDIDYMDGFRCFTWNPTTFPDPAGLVADLHSLHLRAVAMIDPGIKADPSYAVCAEGIAQDMFCKLPDGSLFRGPVWPGDSHFPDFTSPRVRDWWGGLYADLVELGIDGFWNDMNEPTVFHKSTLPDAVVHDVEGRGGNHRQAHSAYGMQMVRATYEGLNRLRPGRRNWVFTRSGYAGVQRFASSWTGDNWSDWDDLRLTPAMLLNLGLSGLSFTGADVGGFIDAPTPELFARWISMAAFTPFFRSHTAKNTPPQEPWSFGAEVEDIARTYIGLRYRLLPYLYTAFWQCSATGLPIMRPMFFATPDVIAHAIDDQWLLGDHLLIAPVLQSGATSRTVYLPPGLWYDFWTDETMFGPTTITRPAPLHLVPIYVRAGTVLPLGPHSQYTDEHPTAPLELHLYPGVGESWLYEDDGETLAHHAGAFRLSRFHMTQDGDALILQRWMEDGYQPPYSEMQVQVHGALAGQTPSSPRLLPATRWTETRITLAAGRI